MVTRAEMYRHAVQVWLLRDRRLQEPISFILLSCFAVCVLLMLMLTRVLRDGRFI